MRKSASLVVAAVAVLLLTSQKAHSHTTLFTPNGGEKLAPADVFRIDWEVTIAHELQNWDLWYSTDSADGPWIDIAMDIAAGDPTEGSLHSFDWTLPDVSAPNAWVRVRMDNVEEDYFDASDSSFSIMSTDSLDCDFTLDGICDIGDLNQMLQVGGIASGVDVTDGVNDQFDLNTDLIINNSDVDLWLAQAANENGLPQPYNRGDADLNGFTDGQDFLAWNTSKFQLTTQWDRGDFNGDGTVDGGDFLQWNQNKFAESDVLAVPEASLSLWFVPVILLAYRRLRPR